MTTAKENLYAIPEAELEGGRRISGGVTEGILAQLQGTRGWARLISIVLMLLGLLTLFGALALVGAAAASGLGVMGYAMAGVIALGVVLYVWLGVLLFRYASAITRALESRAAVAVREAVGIQRRFWRTASILGLIGCILGAVNIAVTSRYMPSFQSGVFDTQAN